jgi:hypothetical protein
VLALTPVPLQTAGERAVFGELTRWDTGGSVRAAVMASIPLTDGSSQRRLSDAVLFVPEGLAVVRIAEVVRQSGMVTASPEGAWIIAPESGPSQALQLSGGGSTPLDGLMRAGMDAAMKLRRAGLEPGRIARLTLLVGDITGLVPADGDLGEGDQVAMLDPRSLLLGIARAGRYAGVDNPRLWTTADVRAALEALGLEGRGPSVEELNGEGFPYSPYVLRRAELLTPAAMAASASAAPEAPSGPSATAVPLVGPGTAAAPAAREQPDPAAIAQAVAASAAAGHAAQASVPPTPPAPPVQRDTVAIDDPKDHAGIGGLFAGAQPDDPVAVDSSARTSVFPASGPPPRTSVFAAQSPAESAPPPEHPPVAFWSRSAAATQPPVEEAQGPGRRAGLLIGAALAVVLVLGGIGWFVLGDRVSGDAGSAGASSASDTAAPGPEVGDVQTLGGLGYTLEAVDVAGTCVGHAYGSVADSFGATDCTGLSRALYSTDIGGQGVVVSVARVQMPDATAARALRALADQNGSGNVSDLLREGIRYTGGPAKLSGAEYASALSGATVTIVEAAAAGDAEVSAVELDRVAGDSLALEVPPFPEG